MNLVRFAIATALAWAISISLTGCSSGPDHLQGEDGDENTGVLTAQLTVGNVALNAVSYNFSNSRHTYTGTFNFEVPSGSTSPVATTIASVAAGSDYVLLVNGTTVDQMWSCRGDLYDIAVSPGRTTPVDLTMHCNKLTGSGKLVVNGTVKLCPAIDDLWADEPSYCTIPLHLSVSDEGQLGGVSYSWQGASGLEGTDPVVTCTSVDPIQLTVFVGNSDPQCLSIGRLTVKCRACP